MLFDLWQIFGIAVVVFAVSLFQSATGFGFGMKEDQSSFLFEDVIQVFWIGNSHYRTRRKST